MQTDPGKETDGAIILPPVCTSSHWESFKGNFKSNSLIEIAIVQHF